MSDDTSVPDEPTSDEDTKIPRRFYWMYFMALSLQGLLVWMMLSELESCRELESSQDIFERNDIEGLGGPGRKR